MFFHFLGIFKWSISSSIIHLILLHPKTTRPVRETRAKAVGIIKNKPGLTFTNKRPESGLFKPERSKIAIFPG
jgi:hypothetical protein